MAKGLLGLNWRPRRKPKVLTAELCQTITNYLSDNEGLTLQFGLDKHDGGLEYRTRSGDGNTCWGMYILGKDLFITDALVRNVNDGVYHNIMTALENAVRAHGDMRIIVQDTHDYRFSMYLLRNGYSPGLGTDDYRKFIRRM